MSKLTTIKDLKFFNATGRDINIQTEKLNINIPKGHGTIYIKEGTNKKANSIYEPAIKAQLMVKGKIATSDFIIVDNEVHPYVKDLQELNNKGSFITLSDLFNLFDL